MKTSKLLVVVIVLQSLMLLGQWVGPSYVTSAQAQANDPARDRLQTLDELRSIDAKLDKMADILGSGDLQVRVANPDDIKVKSGGR
jgi:hypothetical protein